MTKSLRSTLILLISLLVLAAVLWMNRALFADTPDGPPPSAPAGAAQGPAPGPANQASAGAEQTVTEVSVTTVTTDSYRASVNAYGEAAARYSLTLTARVTGYVSEVNDAFYLGNTVSKGDVLLSLDDTAYSAAVAAARDTLAEAEVTLLEEQQTAAQALREWRASGLSGEPDSELTLNKPQVRAAQAAVDNARAALASALQDLRDTQIKAPFDALVVERDAAPGSVLSSGTEVGTVYSTDAVEITVLVPPESGALINTQDAQPVKLQSIDGQAQWEGRILSLGQHLDSETRQLPVVIVVDSPLDQEPPLLPGSFVKVTMQGVLMDNLWQLPVSSLSQRGEIWYVNENNTLSRFSAEPAFSDENGIYISPPQELAGRRVQVLTQPLSSYLENQPVKAKEGLDNE
ncbi:efflux RND transporter periplasmic adaptor subunit [Granulosicoccaceae sp. 1_MG-2023]|nr:efflux RND transporter periplasmic adaptor subunit [Granulosicoccaceae sp. 1_MG-2023]